MSTTWHFRSTASRCRSLRVSCWSAWARRCLSHDVAELGSASGVGGASAPVQTQLIEWHGGPLDPLPWVGRVPYSMAAQYLASRDEERTAHIAFQACRGLLRKSAVRSARSTSPSWSWSRIAEKTLLAFGCCLSISSRASRSTLGNA